MNKVHPYRDLEHEYITSQISIRELCRRHGISAHSLVTVQARKGKWAEKREQYQAKASDAYIERYAARQADRQAEIHDKALDAIDEAITRFREDLRATEKKLVDGEWVEVPVMRLTPRDLAVLIDRLQILFDRPSRISEGRDLGVKSEIPIDALNQLVELTRGRAVAPASPLPRAQRLDD
jgi:transposase-like protein